VPLSVDASLNGDLASTNLLGIYTSKLNPRGSATDIKKLGLWQLDPSNMRPGVVC
jgi:hypothetical protein